jgi:citrate synthase
MHHLVDDVPADVLLRGVILDFAEVPAPMMPAMFTCARTAGWSAHILEQKRLNKLVRPIALYTGSRPRTADTVEGWTKRRACLSE